MKTIPWIKEKELAYGKIEMYRRSIQLVLGFFCFQIQLITLNKEIGSKLKSFLRKIRRICWFPRQFPNGKITFRIGSKEINVRKLFFLVSICVLFLSIPLKKHQKPMSKIVSDEFIENIKNRISSANKPNIFYSSYKNVILKISNAQNFDIIPRQKWPELL